MDLTKRTWIPAACIGAAVVLCACSGGSGSGGSPQQSTSTVTSTATVMPTPSTSPPTSSSKASSGTSRTTASRRCSPASLQAKVLKTGAGAGSAFYTVGLRNTGSTECTLRGFPGVSMVAGSSGAQIGAPAERAIESRSLQVKLIAGESATFELTVAQAANYPGKACQPTAARGFRIYPPGSTAALFLPRGGLVGCAVKASKVLTVGPVQ